MRRFTENIKNKRALTLIEIIIVLAVLGILALIAVPRYINTLENAKRDADKNSVASVSDAIYLAIASEKIPMAEDTITLTGKNGEGINGELDKYDLVLSNLLGTAENRKLQVAEKAEFEILSDGSVEYVISWPSGSNNTETTTTAESTDETETTTEVASETDSTTEATEPITVVESIDYNSRRVFSLTFNNTIASITQLPGDQWSASATPNKIFTFTSTSNPTNNTIYTFGVTDEFNQVSNINLNLQGNAWSIVN